MSNLSELASDEGEDFVGMLRRGDLRSDDVADGDVPGGTAAHGIAVDGEAAADGWPRSVLAIAEGDGASGDINCVKPQRTVVVCNEKDLSVGRKARLVRIAVEGESEDFGGAAYSG